MSLVQGISRRVAAAGLPALFGLAALTALGCDLGGGSGGNGNDAGTSGGTTAGGCLITAQSQCTDHVGTNYIGSVTASGCGTVGGTYLAAGCPTANAVGTCTVNEDPTRLVYYYYSDGGASMSMASASVQCSNLGGVFAPL